MPIYKYRIEGNIWLSTNGKKAYDRGEKPKFLFEDQSNLISTTYHYIAKKTGVVIKRELVMFYRK